jgi:hypothetical protein
MEGEKKTVGSDGLGVKKKCRRSKSFGMNEESIMQSLYFAYKLFGIEKNAFN